MKQITFKITGTLPLLMHNARLASTLDKYARMIKEISGKRKKTDDDHENMALIEARGSLYHNSKDGIYMPGENIEACLLASAKLQKLGTTIKRGARVVDINCPLIYAGPKDPDELVRNQDFIFSKLVKVGTSRVLRTRPVFNQWGCVFSVAYMPDQLNKASIIEIVNNAGQLIGLGDWRPRFGLFDSEVVNES